jgi:hypothetical protein
MNKNQKFAQAAVPGGEDAALSIKKLGANKVTS